MLISVVIPIYNVENYLKECVDSILQQTFSDYEIILVDDGSTDKSAEICDSYAESDSRITVIHKENGGQSTARNRGVEAAKGKYIFFIDSDDAVSDKTAFSQISTVLNDEPDIAAYRYSKWYSDKTVDINVSFDGINATNKTDIVRELVKRDAFYCSCWSKVTKASLLKDNGIKFDESSKCEDMDWYFNVIQNASTIKLIDKPFINYRQREGSVTKKSGEKGFKDNIEVISKYKALFSECTDSQWREVMLSALAKLYCNLLIAFSSNYGQLKKYADKVYENKQLLKYDLNPRTKKIRSISKLVGVRFTCQLLRIASLLR